MGLKSKQMMGFGLSLEKAIVKMSSLF